MSRLIEDGNVVGRVGALLVLAAAVFLVAKISGVIVCPMSGDGCCFPAASRTAKK